VFDIEIQVSVQVDSRLQVVPVAVILIWHNLFQVSPSFCIKSWRLAQTALGEFFLFEGSEKAGFDGFPAGFVDRKAVPPGMGRATEDAGELSDFTAIITGGDVGCSFNTVNQSSSSRSVFGFISVKEGHVCGPFHAVVGGQGVQDVSWVQVQLLSHTDGV
jgi:hypothetical protein